MAQKSTDGPKHCELLIRDCGLAAYHQILDLQLQLWQQRCEEKIPNTILILEHHPVITLGARQSENKLLISKESLAEMGIELATIRRGGGATAHNPGQVVLYPIMNLRSLGFGANEYIRSLEDIGIELLSQLGVSAGRRKGFPGLWTNERKIGSIGVQIKKWVTIHGMAINIDNDLSIFETIVPCGLEGVRMTNVFCETGKENSMTEVKKKLSQLCVKYYSSLELVRYETYR